MLETFQETDVCTLKSDQLEVQWRYEQDRWQHRILVGPSESRQLLLDSAESPNLVTPVFQELRLEHPETDVAEVQLFGQAGRVVYSAAIRLEAIPGRIHFDIAARIARGVELNNLGSHYASGPLDVQDFVPEDAVCRLACHNGVSMEFEAVWLASGPPSQIRFPDSTSLAVGCFDLHLSNNEPGTTVRWCYETHLLDPNG